LQVFAFILFVALLVATTSIMNTSYAKKQGGWGSCVGKLWKGGGGIISNGGDGCVADYNHCAISDKKLFIENLLIILSYSLFAVLSLNSHQLIMALLVGTPRRT